MPTRREQAIWQDGYSAGYREGYNDATRRGGNRVELAPIGLGMETEYAFRQSQPTRRRRPQKPKKKRTLSKWQKFMKSPKSQIKIKRGKDKGKLNLKAMGRAYRKEQKGKK